MRLKYSFDLKPHWRSTFFSCDGFYFPARLMECFILSDLLDTPWSLVSSLLPPGTFLRFCAAEGSALPLLVDLHRVCIDFFPTVCSCKLYHCIPNGSFLHSGRNDECPTSIITGPAFDARSVCLSRGVMSSSDACGDRKSSASSAAGFAAREAVGALALKAAPAAAVAAEDELERCFEVSGTNGFAL